MIIYQGNEEGNTLKTITEVTVMSTYMPKGKTERQWYVLDAEGRTLGEVAVEAAVSSMTVVFFSSNDRIVFACNSGEAAYFANTKIEMQAIKSGITNFTIFVVVFFILFVPF